MTRLLSIPALISALVAITSLFSAVQGHGPVDLGLADPYVILAGSAITSAGTSGTVVTGNIGTSPGAAISGFPPGILNGAADSANGASGAAQGALTTAYNFIATRPFNTTLSNQDLGGMILLPGVYKFDVDANMNGMLTLDANGSANAVWMFQIGAALLVAKDSSIIFKDSIGNADYVYWQIGSSATIAAGVPMIGNMLALTAITVGNKASVLGRCLARNAAVTLDVSAVTIPPKVPTSTPTAAPSMMPSLTPSVNPTTMPSATPTMNPSAAPSINPSTAPSMVPSTNPTVVPTVSPSLNPSASPSIVPSVAPSAQPSLAPSASPTMVPSLVPTVSPSIEASAGPTFANQPTAPPTFTVTTAPINAPTLVPTVAPSAVPSVGPSAAPSTAPTLTPSANPSVAPSVTPTVVPTVNPSASPSVTPSTAPSTQPTMTPSANPSIAPSNAPSVMPSVNPSASPSISPSAAPSTQPSAAPSSDKSEAPSMAPTTSPSATPSAHPSVTPTTQPSVTPSASPSAAPSTVPTVGPSIEVTAGPSVTPTASPSAEPSAVPSARPSFTVTYRPTFGELPVELGLAEPYAILAGATVTSTGVVGTVVTGNIGVFPGSAVTGFPPGILNGAIDAANGAAGGANGALTTAYNAVAARQFNTTLTNQDLGGMTLAPGVYRFDGGATMNGMLTLDARGDAAAVWMFQIGNTLLVAEGSSVIFKDNIGNPDFVFWQVGSSATLAKGVTVVGNILALASITVNNGATVKGRCLARNGAVTLDKSVITKPAVIAFTATQTVSGISLEQFNANITKNTAIMVESIAKTMPGVLPSNIKNFEATAGPTTAAVALFLRRTVARALAGSSIILKYDVVVSSTKTAEQLQTELKTAVNDGTFNSYMQAAAEEQGATALTTATSDSIETETITPPDNTGSSNSSERLSGAAIAGIVIGVVLAFMFIFVLLAFWWTGGFSAHSSAPAAAPADDTKRTYVAVAAAVPGVAPEVIANESSDSAAVEV